MLELTQHAEVRMQQRGITRSMLDSLLDYGAIVYDHRGATIVYFDRKARTRLLRESGGTGYRGLEKQLNTYAVVAPNGAIVTVGRRHKRIFKPEQDEHRCTRI